MSILVVGTVAFDSIETPFGSAERILGGSASYFALGASFFAPVRIVGVIGQDFPQEYLDLFTQRNIDLEGVKKESGDTFHWRGRYHEDINVRDTLELHLNVLAGFVPDLPERYRDAEYVFLLSGQSNIVRAAREILKMGPKVVLIKRGEYGVLQFSDSSIFATPAYPLEEVFDPTGAGDSFAGGFLGQLARSGELTQQGIRRAIVYGSVVASFTVEDFGVKRLTSVTLRDIEERYKGFVQLTDFHT
jgi:sugar/nucleoside kinase (ribokinase family)